ncbi:Leu/Ile/Val/Thr-binding protein precursor [bacterium YEK0313]|nr:Leu/Ile/Val/Thr-binding protein precursor [bacterium YEK0313]
MDRRSLLKSFAAAPALSLAGRAYAQAGEIRIGYLGATSGPAAFLGTTSRNAFDMLVEQYNAKGGLSGRKITAIPYDTEGNSTIAAQQFRRLAESDRADVIIGPNTTGEALVTRTIAEELKIPMISMTGTESIVVPPTPHVFKVAPTDRAVSRHMLQFAKAKGWNSLGIISSADGFGQAGATYLKENARKMDLKIALAEEFGPRDTDMTPQILRLRRANVDAMLIWSVNPGPTIILRNAAAAGFGKPIVNSFGVASAQLLDQAGRTAENTYVSTMRLLIPDQLPPTDPLQPVVAKVAADYRARFNAPVATFSGHAYDALKLIELAVAKTNGDVTRAAITAAIHSGIAFPGCNGEMKYSAANHGGQDDTSNPMVMVQVKNGKFVIAQ